MPGAYRAGMFHLGVVVAAAAMLVGLAIPSSGPAQEATPLPVEDVLRVRSFADLVPARFSADGKRLAYTVQDHQRKRWVSRESLWETGIPPWGVACDIFVLDVASGDSKNISGGTGDNWLPAWSPDGRYLAFLSDRGQDDYARLWIWDVVKNELRKVSDAKVFAKEILWTPDSLNLVVTAIPERPFAGTQARDGPSPAAQPSAAPTKNSDSTVILYGAAERPSSDKKKPSSDPWDLNAPFLRDLILVKVSDGSSTQLVKGGRIARYQLSPDGSHIAYTIPTRFEKAASQQILFDLAVIALDTREVRVLESDIRLHYDGAAFNWSPDGMQLAFRKGGMEERRFDVFMVRRDGGVQNVSGLSSSETRLAYDPGIPFWNAKGDSIYFLRDGVLWRSSVGGSRAEKVAEVPGRRIVRFLTQSGNLIRTSAHDEALVITHDDSGKQDGFYKVSLNHGGSFKLMEKGQCYTCVHIDEWQFADVSGDRQSLAFYVEDAQHSPDLWIGDPSFRAIRRVSHLNPQFDKVAMGAAHLIEWRSGDGQPLRGALLLPSNYEEGQRYPLLVWVYGGSLLSNQFDHFGLGPADPFNMQIFATRGYAVLMPDAPQNMGTPMVDLAKTVLPGVDKVIEMGIADPERLGVMGHSYGSYSTLSLIVQTKRFKAALAADGFGNLISAYGQMDAQGGALSTSILEAGPGGMGGPPWEFPQRYIQNSPFFYLDRVETPLLIVHGTQDRTVAPFLGDELFVGLRRLGKTVLYAKYQGEDHAPVTWSYGNQLDLSNRMIAWFDQYLKQPSDAGSRSSAKIPTTR